MSLKSKLIRLGFVMLSASFLSALAVVGAIRGAASVLQ